MNDLDALLTRNRAISGRGCRWRGCTDPTRAVVQLQLRRFAEGSHTAGNYDGSVSRQVSLCETHAVAAWQAVWEALDV